MDTARKSDKQRDFEREALPHIDLLHNFARRLTNSQEDAADLVQETYLKAFRFWDGYQKGTNIKAWLFRILRNSHINRYRRDEKGPDFVDVEASLQSGGNGEWSAAAVSDSMFSNLMEDDVAKAISSLPLEFRTVVILCDIEGLTYEEIAEFADCPIGTVRSRIHRGRRILRSVLAEYARRRGYVPDDENS